MTASTASIGTPTIYRCQVVGPLPPKNPYTRHLFTKKPTNTKESPILTQLLQQVLTKLYKREERVRIETEIDARIKAASQKCKTAIKKWREQHFKSLLDNTSLIKVPKPAEQIDSSTQISSQKKTCVEVIYALGCWIIAETGKCFSNLYCSLFFYR